MPRAAHSWMAPSLHSNICRPWFRKYDTLLQLNKFFYGWLDCIGSAAQPTDGMSCRCQDAVQTP